MFRFFSIFSTLGFCFASLWFSLSASAQSPSTQSHTQETTTILFLGDSLTAGYGLPQNSGYPEQLAKTLGNVTVINAGVSGDTTTGLLNRLEWATAGMEYDIAVVAIGANDALMGISPEKTEANMERIMQILNNNKTPIFILGMNSPPKFRG